MNDLLPHQEAKIEWIEQHGTETVVNHFQDTDAAVVTGVTRALAQLAVVPQGRDILFSLKCGGTVQFASDELRSLTCCLNDRTIVAKV